MKTLQFALEYFLSFQPYVMLPVIIFIMALIFKIKIATALKSALTLGIAFIGIFMTFDYFVTIINPVIKAFISRTGMNMPVLEAGWPPLAGIAWSYDLAPLLLVIFMLINAIMLVTRLTKTVNIDIWNYWHVIFLAALINFMTDSVLLALLFSSLSFILVLKLAEWSAPRINKLSGMNGVCIPHLSAITYFPFALVISKVLDVLPGIKNIKADPESINKRLGLLGEPMILGLIIGLLLGVAGGYELRELLNLAFGFAAVVFILPKMGEILGSALIPISEGMKEFISKHFPQLGITYIGLDIAVLFGIPSVLVTALLMIPISIFLAIILPGVTFIPIGDLTNLLVPVGIISAATRGNILKSVIITIPVVISNLYYASIFAKPITQMASKYNFTIEGYDGLFTSFLDGGQSYRCWLVQLLNLEYIGIAIFPVVVFFVFITWRIVVKESKIAV